MDEVDEVVDEEAGEAEGAEAGENEHKLTPCLARVCL